MKIEYRFDEDGMVNEEYEDIEAFLDNVKCTYLDVAASKERFAELVTEELKLAFPKAEIEVVELPQVMGHNVEVWGDEAANYWELCQEIQEMAEDVWARMEWVVET